MQSESHAPGQIRSKRENGIDNLFEYQTFFMDNNGL